MTTKVDAWKCDKCGVVYISKYFSESCDCDKTYKCSECGVEVSKYRNKCAKCSENIRYEKAKKLTIDEYQEKMIFDDKLDRYMDFGDLADYYHDHPEEAKPKWVTGCNRIDFQINIEDSLENAAEGMYEDFDYEQSVDYDVLMKFIENWNKKQTDYCYQWDGKTVVMIPEEFWR